MTGRGQAAVPVRRADRRRVVERLAGRVDDHERDVPRPELVAHRLAEVGEDGDHAGRPPSEDALDPAAAGCPPALHLRQDHRQVMPTGDTLHAPDDLQRPLAVELVEDQLEDGRDPLIASRPVVAVLADGRLDPPARLGRHVGSAVDHLRDRRHRHAGLCGDDRDRRPVPRPAPLRARRSRSCIQCSDIDPKVSNGAGPRDAARLSAWTGVLGSCRLRLDAESNRWLGCGTETIRTSFRNFRATGGRSSARPMIADQPYRRPANTLLRWRDDASSSTRPDRIRSTPTRATHRLRLARPHAEEGRRSVINHRRTTGGQVNDVSSRCRDPARDRGRRLRRLLER